MDDSRDPEQEERVSQKLQDTPVVELFPEDDSDLPQEKQKSGKNGSSGRRRLRSSEPAQKNSPEEASGKTPEELLAEMNAAAGTRRIRLGLLFFLTVLSAAITVLAGIEQIPIPFLKNEFLVRCILVGLLAAAMLLSADLITAAFRELRHVRFGMEFLAELTSVISLLDGILVKGHIPCCAAASLVLTFVFWGSYDRIIGIRRSAKAISGKEDTKGILCRQATFNGTTAVLRGPAELQSFSGKLEGRDAAQFSMHIYSPILAVISLVLALAASGRTGRPVVRVWSILLCASFPLMGALNYSRPFSRLAGHLKQSGSMICGWQGARMLHRSACLLLGDRDLFPDNSVLQNGMRVYGSYRPGQIVSYAATVIQTAESGLSGLMENMMRECGAHVYPVGNFRRYEGGGYGAEVGGDVILAGSRSFMRLLGVPIVEEIPLKSALYIAVNKEPAGVIVLNYTAKESSRDALKLLLRSRLVPVLCLRDCMVTPAIIKSVFKLPASEMEFPTAEKRAALAHIESGDQAGMVAGGDFYGFAEAAAGGSVLCRVTRRGIALSITGSVFELALMTFVALSGSDAALQAWKVLAMGAAWTIPQFLQQLTIDRY